MVSFESTEGTNSLLMKSPVGTEIFLVDAGMAMETGVAMVCWWWVKMVGSERERSGVAKVRLVSPWQNLGDKAMEDHGKDRYWRASIESK